MNVSTRYSELYLYIYQYNGEAVKALLQMIGTHIWTEAERLLVDLLQQVPQLLQVSFLSVNSHFNTFTLSPFYLSLIHISEPTRPY